MENPEEIQQNGPLEPEHDQEPKIGGSNGFSMEDAAEKYVKELREKFKEMKAKGDDPHLNLINPDDLTYGDLVIFDKWINGTLTKEDFEDYSREVRTHFESVRRANGAKSEIKELKKEYSSGFISGEEFDEKFREILSIHGAEEGWSGGGGVIPETDSSANFEAMVRNRMVASRKI